MNFPYQSCLILVAMDVEEQAMLPFFPSQKLIEIHLKLNIFVREFCAGPHKIYLANAGIGSVNSGVATALITQRYPVEAILLLGVAGALHKELGIGDWMVASQILQHDSLWSTATIDELMPPGQLHISLPAEQRQSPVFTADPQLYQWIGQVLKLSPDKNYKTGTLLSGSEFVGRLSRKETLVARHPRALAVEMEAAGVALIAQKLQIPFLAAKTISDRYQAVHCTTDDYLLFKQKAAEHAGWLMQQLVRECLLITLPKKL